jgi:hypothetical protein
MKVGRRRHGVIITAPGCQGRASTLPCCRRRRRTGGGGPRSEGGSTAGRWRGDRGIAAVVTAALVQWARLPTRGARAGAALAASDREGGHWRRMPVHDGSMGDREGGEGATATGGGGSRGGRGEAAGTPSLVGLRRRWTTMVRMTMESGGTKQQPTP